MPSLRSVLLTTLSLTLIAGLIYYLYLNANQYLALLRVSAASASLLLLLSALFPFLTGLANAEFFASMGIKMRYSDVFSLTAASALVDQLPVSAGVVSKGLYLKRWHAVSYTRFFSATLALFFCYTGINGFTGILTLLFQAWMTQRAPSALLLAGFAGMAACPLIFLLPVEKFPMPEPVYRRLEQALSGWQVISQSPRLLARLVLIQLILMFLLALRYWLAFDMLSQDVSLAQALLFSNASILTQLVSIAPGGLGVREALVGAVAAFQGFDTAVSVVAVSLDRLVSSLVIFVCGGFGLVVMGRRLSEDDLPIKETLPRHEHSL